jgi:hypothetical protein
MTIHSLHTTIHSCRFMTQIHHTQLNHGATSLPVPPPSPSLDLPMFRTPSTSSRPADEEGYLKT